jgi:hypothetical protein
MRSISQVEEDGGWGQLTFSKKMDARKKEKGDTIFLLCRSLSSGYCEARRRKGKRRRREGRKQRAEGEFIEPWELCVD